MSKMQRHFFTIFLFAFGLNNIDIATSQWTAMGVYHNDAHPGKCYISESIILSPGERAKKPGQCSEMTCSNEDGLVRIVGCGAVLPPPKCKWGEYINVDAPYPECCARHLICENPANQTMATEYEEHTLNMFRRSRARREAEHAQRAEQALQGAAQLHKEL